MKPFLSLRLRTGLPKTIRVLTIVCTVCCTLVLGACSNDSILDNSYSLTDENGRQVRFPGDYQGKILVVSYIYTHCPNACVVTTDGMKRLRQTVGDRDDVMFISITLDPARDSVGTLRRYSASRSIDTQHWHFLTGAQGALDSLFQEMEVVYRTSFVERTQQGDNVYFIDHSDVVTLIDQEGRIQGRYKGTELDVDHVVKKINEIS